jgi:hypothetical protein
METWQKEPVRLSMALTSLAGLTYALPEITQSTPVYASTFLDWYNVTLTSNDNSDAYLDYANAAIASGSNALAFPPKKLNRLDDKERYKKAGLIDFPIDGWFWYTDGGTVDNEPLGRTIDLVQDIESDDERLYLLIHPEPGVPSSTPSNVWGGDAPQPPWVRTGTHVLSISRNQSIYEDLKRLQKTNSYVEWIGTIKSAVLSGVETGINDAGLSEEQAGRLRASLTAELQSALGGVRRNQRDKAERANRTLAAHVSDDVESFGDLLDILARAASGLEGREPIKVEIVSPTIDPHVHKTPSEQLAGAFLFHFGGFFDVRFRQSDFELGYRNMEYWLALDLGRHLPGVDLSAALNAVREGRNRFGWDHVDLGGEQLGELSFEQKAELAELAIHVAHVIEYDALHHGV